jgi:hypothetical protein
MTTEEQLKHKLADTQKRIADLKLVLDRVLSAIDPDNVDMTFARKKDRDRCQKACVAAEKELHR